MTKTSGDSELCLFKPLFFHATQLQSCAWQNNISILCLFQLKEANQEPDRLMGTEPHFLASCSTCEAKQKAAQLSRPCQLGSRAPPALLLLLSSQRAECFPGCKRHGPAGNPTASPGLLSTGQRESAGLLFHLPQPAIRGSAVLLSQLTQQLKNLHAKNMKVW